MWEAIFSSFRYVIPASLLSDPKSCQFQVGPEQKKAQQEVQAAVQAALSLESYELADPKWTKDVNGRQGCSVYPLTDPYR